MSLSRGLVRAIRARPIESADLTAAAHLLLDAAANIVAGVASEPGRKLLAWSSGLGVPGRSSPTDPGRMALLLGGLCHIQEVDDLHRKSVVHPGCVVAPVLWALAADRHSGRDVLTAFLHGIEAATRVGMAVGPAHYRIWHNTATCGPFGAAMAAGALLGLDEDQLVHAMGNAGTQAAGLWEFLEEGAMSKHLHAGRAAEAGVVSAGLAAHGFTGPSRILEGERGVFRAMCADGDPARVLAEPGAPWQAHQTSIKPWPSCRHTHPAIAAAQDIRHQLGQAGHAAIDAVVVEAYDAALALCDRPLPDSTYGAKFSLQHCVAAALAFDPVDFAAFEADALGALAPLRARIKVGSAEPYCANYPKRWGSAVTVRLRQGGEIRAARLDTLGDPEAPLSLAQLTAKARTLLNHGGHRAPDRLIAGILAMADGARLPALGLHSLTAAPSGSQASAPRSA